MAEHFGIKALHLMLSGLGPISKEDKTLFKKKSWKIVYITIRSEKRCRNTQVSGQAECCLCQMFVPMPFIHVITK